MYGVSNDCYVCSWLCQLAQWHSNMYIHWLQSTATPQHRYFTNDRQLVSTQDIDSTRKPTCGRIARLLTEHVSACLRARGAASLAGLYTAWMSATSTTTIIPGLLRITFTSARPVAKTAPPCDDATLPSNLHTYTYVSTCYSYEAQDAHARHSRISRRWAANQMGNFHGEDHNKDAHARQD